MYMQRKLMLAAAAVMMLAACNGSKTTQLSAQFGDNAPETVKVTVGEVLDKTVEVEDGKFEFEAPVDVTTISRIRAGMSVFSFISDGTKITLNLEDGKAYSNKKGVHTRYVEYNKWMDEFTKGYRKRLDEIGDDKAAADAYFNEMLGKYNDFQKTTFRANKDNILGVTALSHLQIDDAKELLSLFNSLSAKMKETPEALKLKKALENELK